VLYLKLQDTAVMSALAVSYITFQSSLLTLVLSPRCKCLTGLKLPTSLIRLTLHLPGDGSFHQRSLARSLACVPA